MATINDRVFVGPGTVTWVSDDIPEDCHPQVAFSWYETPVRQSEIHPWHPALPKLAALLADPGFVEAVGSAVVHYRTYGIIPDEDMVALVALAAALTEGADGNS